MTDIDAVCEAVVQAKNAEIEKLLTRQQELLQLVANISQSTPLDSEVAEALEQRGKLLAEIGTLRAQLYQLRQETIGVSLANDDVHKLWEAAKAELAVARPIVEAAKEWFRAEHCFDSDCTAGEHDHCPARVAEEALRALLEKML